MPKKYSNEERLKSLHNRIDSKGPDDCWPWLGATDKAGKFTLVQLGAMFKVSFGMIGHIIARRTWDHI